jgi:hypothetical protein
MEIPEIVTPHVKIIVAKLHDVKNSLPGIMNPNQLRLSVGVSISKQHPIGSSHPTKQYSHTEDVQAPLEFYFSDQILRRQGVPGPIPVQTAAEWCMSCAYSRAPGYAPDPLLILWPHVWTAAYAVERVDVEYVRFNAWMEPSAAKITITGGELRDTFRTQWFAEDAEKAWLMLDNNSSIRLGTGRPLNLIKR